MLWIPESPRYGFGGSKEADAKIEWAYLSTFADANVRRRQPL